MTEAEARALTRIHTAYRQVSRGKNVQGTTVEQECPQCHRYILTNAPKDRRISPKMVADSMVEHLTGLDVFNPCATADEPTYSPVTVKESLG